MVGIPQLTEMLMNANKRTMISTLKPDDRLTIEFPTTEQSLEQDSEWCYVKRPGEGRRKIRFHDYEKIFVVPGLYEQLFYQELRCNSPRKVTELLLKAVAAGEDEVANLRVLDVGAGNGMMGEELSRHLQIDYCVGVDIIPEASQAAWRDRRSFYDDYYVSDLTKLDDFTRARLAGCRFNCMSCVAALGFGDIPIRAFAEAFNLVASSGWIVFNIRDSFLDPADDTGFCRLIRRLKEAGILESQVEERYCHRLNMRAEKLHYVGLVGRKRADIPTAWIDDLEDEVSESTESQSPLLELHG